MVTEEYQVKKKSWVYQGVTAVDIMWGFISQK